MSDRLQYGYRDTLKKSDLKAVYQHEGTQGMLPCERITNPVLTIGLLATTNNVIDPSRFNLSGKDRQLIQLTDSRTGQIFSMSHPGKSAFLYFDDGSIIDKTAVKQVVADQMKRDMSRHDHLHLASIADLEAAGWEVWWTPLQERQNWVHVRLVPKSIIAGAASPSQDELIAISGAFKKAA